MLKLATPKQRARLETEEGVEAYKERAEARMRQHDALPADLRAVSNDYGLRRANEMKVSRTVQCFESLFDGT